MGRWFRKFFRFGPEKSALAQALECQAMVAEMNRERWGKLAQLMYEHLPRPPSKDAP